jgi:hypothetical protein
LDNFGIYIFIIQFVRLLNLKFLVMVFNRRLFLQKTAVLVGLVSTPSLGWAKALFKEKKYLDHVIQLGGESLKNLSLKSFSESKLSFSRSLTFVTSNFPSVTNQLQLLGGIKPDAMLFGGEMLLQNRDRYLDSTGELIPSINSNFSFQSERSKMVSKYLIEERAGVRIGIMGIGFGEKGQSIPATIKLMNSQAEQLKSELACDEVYCLTEKPDSSTPFTLRDLVENSKGINQFFASCSIVSTSNLWVLPNSNMEEALLSIHSLIDPNQSQLSFEDGRFLIYK